MERDAQQLAARARTAMVRPQKLPAANTMRALPSGIPFTSYPLPRTSTASG